jgi:hypothetical protein
MSLPILSGPYPLLRLKDTAYAFRIPSSTEERYFSIKPLFSRNALSGSTQESDAIWIVWEEDLSPLFGP